MHTVRTMHGISRIDGFSVDRHGSGLRRNGKCERFDFFFRNLYIGQIDDSLGISCNRDLSVYFRSAICDTHVVIAFRNKDHHLGFDLIYDLASYLHKSAHEIIVSFKHDITVPVVYGNAHYRIVYTADRYTVALTKLRNIDLFSVGRNKRLCGDTIRIAFDL